MKAEASVGPQIGADGSTNDARQGRLGALVVTGLHGKYAEQTVRGNVFCATSAAALLQSAGAASGAPLCLYNPPGSGKNLYLIRTVLAPTVTSGTQVAGAIAYYGVNNVSLSATLTVATVNSTAIGSAARGVGVAYSAATVTTNTPQPTLILPFATKFGTATMTSTFPTRIIDDVDGQIGIAPGGLLLLQETTTDTTNITAVVAFVWEEVPV